MIIIRKFKDSDLENLRDLICELNFEVNSVDQGDLIYLAFEDEKLIGVIKASESEKLWYLDCLYMATKSRNRSIGDGLLRVAIDKLEKNGVESLYFNGENQYLTDKGFKENTDKQLVLDVKNFFNNKSCCGDIDEL